MEFSEDSEVSGSHRNVRKRKNRDTRKSSEYCNS